MKSFNYKKAVQVVNFFANREGGTINKLKALKLVWLADRLHLRVYSRPIINDTYYALEHGPVASVTRDIIQQNQYLQKVELEYSTTYLSRNGDLEITSLSEVELKVFSKTDVKILEQIYSQFGNLNQFELRDLSHKYPEWTKFESQLPRGSHGRFLMDYLDFFNNPQNNDSIFNNDTELLELSKQYFSHG